MIYGSVCSGVESASMGWEPLGMIPAWFAEVEAFPSAVLAHHWPHVANFGDMCNLPYLVSTGLIPAPDILVGGTPCQAFSVAGLRKGLEDERGQLTLKFVELANEIDKQRSGEECVVVWENVPGVLSSKDNAFGCFLGALAGEECELMPTGKKWTNAGLVHGPKRAIAWRILDAQYFGVAQRRRRVFVVASARKRFGPGTVLFESEGVRRDTPPSREEAQVVAALTARGVGTCGADDNQAQAGHIVAQPFELANTLTARTQKGVNSNITEGQTPVVCFDSRQDSNVYCDMAGPCSASTPVNAVAFAQNSRDEVRLENGDGQITGALSTGGGKPGQGYPAITLTTGDNHAVGVTIHCTDKTAKTMSYTDVCGALRTKPPGSIENSSTTAIYEEGVVRRLTPVECERLQGFPDNHTRIPWRGKSPEDCPDGPRYKAIGNSKAVPVIRFVGERIIKELFK